MAGFGRQKPAPVPEDPPFTTVSPSLPPLIFDNPLLGIPEQFLVNSDSLTERGDSGLKGHVEHAGSPDSFVNSFPSTAPLAQARFPKYPPHFLSVPDQSLGDSTHSLLFPSESPPSLLTQLESESDEPVELDQRNAAEIPEAGLERVKSLVVTAPSFDRAETVQSESTGGAEPESTVSFRVSEVAPELTVALDPGLDLGYFVTENLELGLAQTPAPASPSSSESSFEVASQSISSLALRPATAPYRTLSLPLVREVEPLLGPFTPLHNPEIPSRHSSHRVPKTLVEDYLLYVPKEIETLTTRRRMNSFCDYPVSAPKQKPRSKSEADAVRPWDMKKLDLSSYELDVIGNRLRQIEASIGRWQREHYKRIEKASGSTATAPDDAATANESRNEHGEYGTADCSGSGPKESTTPTGSPPGQNLSGSPSRVDSNSMASGSSSSPSPVNSPAVMPPTVTPVRLPALPEPIADGGRGKVLGLGIDLGAEIERDRLFKPLPPRPTSIRFSPDTVANDPTFPSLQPVLPRRLKNTSTPPRRKDFEFVPRPAANSPKIFAPHNSSSLNRRPALNLTAPPEVESVRLRLHRESPTPDRTRSESNSRQRYLEFRNRMNRAAGAN